MTNFFPADVSVRVDGNPAAAQQQQLFAKASNLLYSALNYQRANGANDVRFLLSGPQNGLKEGALIFVVLSGGLKQVYITPGPTPVEVTPEPEIIPEIEVPLFFPYSMWSGVARAVAEDVPTVISATDGDEAAAPALAEFHPDEITAAAYARAYAWQTPHKLGVNDAGQNAVGPAACGVPKPGNFSGAMKRVVQALFGIGVIDTDTEGFISEELPDTYPVAYIWNRYDYTWGRTHGIHKSPNDGGIWIIEVSKLNGVLAMQLPLFKGTDGGSFLAWLDAYGDTDTMGVALEFGGLPSGEPFPTGADLAAAIVSGKVLQLISAADLAEFYHDSSNDVTKSGLWGGQGWAFSESGAAADNLTFWSKNPRCSACDDDSYQHDTDGLGNRPANERHITSQWWRLTFNLSTTVSEAHPYGSGSATLNLIEETLVVNNLHQPDGLIAGLVTGGQSQPLLLVPGDNSEFLNRYVFHSRSMGGLNVSSDVGLLSVRAPVHVFYDGERTECVRFVPFPAGFFWDVAGFVGDSLDMGIASLASGGGSIGQLGAVMMAIPAFCREGYVLFKADMSGAIAVPDPKPINLAFPVTFQGFYPQVGTIDLGGFNELFESIISGGPFVTFYTLSHMWLETFSLPNQVFFYGGANFNAGPTRTYLITKGLTVTGTSNGTFGGGSVFRPLYQVYLQSDSLLRYGITAETRTDQVTFVGSP